MRKGAVIGLLTILFSGIGFLFWQYEWMYTLPTPVPEKYKVVANGERINLPFATSRDKPVFLHFFNPHCPCSRFNMGHFKSLVKQYSSEVDFQIVVISDKDYTTKEIQNKFDIDIPVSFDTTAAALCGVYSTPQAVLINTGQRLFYRGNYNKSRYCADKKTEYARVALETLLNKMPAITFDQLALKAYGCQLPKCTK